MIYAHIYNIQGTLDILHFPDTISFLLFFPRIPGSGYLVGISCGRNSTVLHYCAKWCSTRQRSKWPDNSFYGTVNGRQLIKHGAGEDRNPSIKLRLDNSVLT